MRSTFMSGSHVAVESVLEKPQVKENDAFWLTIFLAHLLAIN